jgi:hypothetical protein
MVMNTYLGNNQYIATLAPIDCEDHSILQSPEFRHRPLLGPEGVVDLVIQFHNMDTGDYNK